MTLHDWIKPADILFGILACFVNYALSNYTWPDVALSLVLGILVWGATWRVTKRIPWER